MASDRRPRSAARPLAGPVRALTGAALELGLPRSDSYWWIMGQALTAYVLMARLILRFLPRRVPPEPFGSAPDASL